MNYFLDNKINKAEILFPGVGCFLVAVCLGSAVHASNAADNKEKLKRLSTNCRNETKYVYFFCRCSSISVTRKNSGIN